MKGPVVRIAASLLSGSLLLAECLAQPVPEHELKAAYLYNFALFTTWPEDKLSDEKGAMMFCVYGQTPLSGALAGLQAKKVRERRIVLKQVAHPEEGRPCHVLYLGSAEPEAAAKMLEAVRDSGTLTVTDAPGPRPVGDAVIHLRVEQERLVFDVSLQSARRARLTLSSRLLKLARSVE